MHQARGGSQSLDLTDSARTGPRQTQTTPSRVKLQAACHLIETRWRRAGSARALMLCIMTLFENLPLDSREWNGTAAEGFTRLAGGSESDAATVRSDSSFDELESAIDNFLRIGLQGQVDYVEAQGPDTASHLRIARVHVALSRLGWGLATAVIGVALAIVQHDAIAGAKSAIGLLLSIGSNTHWLSESEIELLTWVSTQQRLGAPSPLESAPSDPGRLIDARVLRSVEGNLFIVF